MAEELGRAEGKALGEGEIGNERKTFEINERGRDRL